jgi:hypothetical protein
VLVVAQVQWRPRLQLPGAKALPEIIRLARALAQVVVALALTAQ